MWRKLQASRANTGTPEAGTGHCRAQERRKTHGHGRVVPGCKELCAREEGRASWDLTWQCPGLWKTMVMLRRARKPLCQGGAAGEEGQEACDGAKMFSALFVWML